MPYGYRDWVAISTYGVRILACSRDVEVFEVLPHFGLLTSRRQRARPSRQLT